MKPTNYWNDKKLLAVTQDKIANRNRSTSDGFTSEFYHIFKGKATLILYKLLQEHEQNEAIHPYHFDSISYQRL